jgi:hypothetical protein
MSLVVRHFRRLSNPRASRRQVRAGCARVSEERPPNAFPFVQRVEVLWRAECQSEATRLRSGRPDLGVNVMLCCVKLVDTLG